MSGKYNVKVAVLLILVIIIGIVAWYGYVWSSTNTPEAVALSFIEAVAENKANETFGLVIPGSAIPLFLSKHREELGGAITEVQRVQERSFLLGTPETERAIKLFLSDSNLDYQLEDITVVVVDYLTADGREITTFVYLHKEGLSWKVMFYTTGPQFKLNLNK